MRANPALAGLKCPPGMAGLLRTACAPRWLEVVLLLIMIPAVAEAQFKWTTNNGSIIFTELARECGLDKNMIEHHHRLANFLANILK